MNSPQARWSLIAAFSTLLVLLTLAAYRDVANCEFVTFDDPQYVYKNSQVLKGLTADGVYYAFTTNYLSNWHPLTWLSLELDVTLFGPGPRGFHTTNLVLHVVNVVLLFLLLVDATGQISLSAAVAALFAVHPLHVESVAWVAERKDVLSTLFLLLTLIAYVHYARSRTVWRYILVAGLFGLGLLAKPMLVTLPVLLLLFDCWPLRRLQLEPASDGAPSHGSVNIPKMLLIEKLPLFAMSFFDGIMTIAAQKSAMQVFPSLPLPTRIANMWEAYLWYLYKTFVPVDLTVFYPHLQDNRSLLLVATGMFVTFGLTGWSLYRFPRNPAAFVGWSWFCISLLPVIGLLQVGGQAYADRYTYIPHIGLFVFFVWEAYAWANSTVRRFVMPVVVVALVAWFAGLTSHQIGYWSNSQTLWTHALEVIPENAVAHAHLSDVYQDAGHHEEALVHFERSVELSGRGNRVDDSWYTNAYYRWAESLLALKHVEDAEQKLRTALKYSDKNVEAIELFLQVLTYQEKTAEAEQFRKLFGAALLQHAQKNPDSAAGQIRLGLAHARQGKFEEAITFFQKAIELAPQSAAAYNNLGMAQRELGQLSQAKSSLEKAIELNPHFASAHFTLGELLLTQKDPAGAKTHFAEAYRLNPEDRQAKAHLDRLSK